MEYCCFNGEAFPRFDFIQYGRHALSYVLVQMTMNVPLVRVKLLLAINGNLDPYSYLYSCLYECSLIICVAFIVILEICLLSWLRFITLVNISVT